MSKANGKVRVQNLAQIVPLTEATADDHAARGAEAERQRVRKVLHDGLGQLLTSISFLAGSLNARLTTLQLPEAAQAEDILALTKQAINETQRLVGEKDGASAGRECSTVSS